MRINGKRAESDRPLAAGDEVVYYMTAAQEAARVCTTLYEDENVLVVDKESGVSSEALFSFLKEKYGPDGVYFLHRLDRNTEGVMIFGHTMSASEVLISAFSEKRVKKIYHALVFGAMPRPHGILHAYLKKDEKRALVRVLPAPAPRALPITTEYEVLEARGEMSLLKITLHTGRTHQIRAHLAFVGHPVVGDEKYGDHVRNKRVHMTRQRLLSKELSLEIPAGPLSYLSGKIFTSQKNL